MRSRIEIIRTTCEHSARRCPHGGLSAISHAGRCAAEGNRDSHRRLRSSSPPSTKCEKLIRHPDTWCMILHFACSSALPSPWTNRRSGRGCRVTMPASPSTSSTSTPACATALTRNLAPQNSSCPAGPSTRQVDPLLQVAQRVRSEPVSTSAARTACRTPGLAGFSISTSTRNDPISSDMLTPRGQPHTTILTHPSPAARRTVPTSLAWHMRRAPPGTPRVQSRP